LAAGVDLEPRRQALWASRDMTAHQLREAELRNELQEQELRSGTAHADLVEKARDERVYPVPRITGRLIAVRQQRDLPVVLVYHH
jgi:hypothetical protein